MEQSSWMKRYLHCCLAACAVLPRGFGARSRLDWDTTVYRVEMMDLSVERQVLSPRLLDREVPSPKTVEQVTSGKDEINSAENAVREALDPDLSS